MEESIIMNRTELITMSPLVLAYLGDTVFESHIREYLITKNINKKVNDLHKSAVKYVNAKAQATIIHNIEDQLTEDELRIYKRGRNQKSHTSPKNADIIDSYKVLIGRLVPSNGELDVDPKDGYKVITDTRIIGPGQINTETYLDIGVFKTLEEAQNFEAFLHTKFARFLLRQAISSLNVTRECFRFVPTEDFTQSWDDQKLYAKYGLSEEEITLIETTIRSMDGGNN